MAVKIERFSNSGVTFGFQGFVQFYWLIKMYPSRLKS